MRGADDKDGTQYVMTQVFAAINHRLSEEYTKIELPSLDAKERCNARTRHGTFDTSVLEINKDDLKVFLETLCEGGER